MSESVRRRCRPSSKERQNHQEATTVDDAKLVRAPRGKGFGRAADEKERTYLLQVYHASQGDEREDLFFLRRIFFRAILGVWQSFLRTYERF